MQTGNYKVGGSIPCSIYRGGTSKGIVFKESDLPVDFKIREEVLLEIMGSPDSKQIDGLGGATNQTSKIVIINESNHPNVDLEYTIGQVILDKPKIDWSGNCGNLSSVVGLFAIDEKMILPDEPITTMKLLNTNTNKLINYHIGVKNDSPLIRGNYKVPGVPKMGSKIELEFINPEGSVTNKLLPTGNEKDVIELEEGSKITVSIVDAGNPTVFLNASNLSLKGSEMPEEIENNKKIITRLQEIRGKVAQLLGFVSDWKKAPQLSPSLPKIGFIGNPTDYISYDNKLIDSNEIDFVARLVSSNKIHKSYMVTGAISTAVAAKIEGTIVNDYVKSKTSNTVNIGHPYGIMDVIVNKDKFGRYSVVIGRTARRLMKGEAYLG